LDGSLLKDAFSVVDGGGEDSEDAALVAGISVTVASDTAGVVLAVVSVSLWIVSFGWTQSGTDGVVIEAGAAFLIVSPLPCRLDASSLPLLFDSPLDKERSALFLPSLLKRFFIFLKTFFILKELQQQRTVVPSSCKLWLLLVFGCYRG